MNIDTPEMNKRGHRCYFGHNIDDIICGTAIEDCWEDYDGRFWVDNGEYGNQVNFCPLCGTKAPTQIDPDKITPLPEHWK